MPSNNNPTLSGMPREMKAMIAREAFSGQDDRTLPSVATGPTFSKIGLSSLAQTSKQMRADLPGIKNDESVLLAAGLDSLAHAPDENQDIWARIQDGTVTHLVLPARKTANQPTHSEMKSFGKTERMLKNLSRDAPDNRVTDIIFDPGIQDAAGYDATLSLLAASRRTLAAARATLEARKDHLHTTMHFPSRPACESWYRIDCPGSLGPPALPSTAFRVWDHQSFSAPRQPWWAASTRAAPPRLNYNLAGRTEDDVLSKFATFCKERYQEMTKTSAERGGTAAYTDVVNLFADTAAYSKNAATSSSLPSTAPNTIINNDQVRKLGPRLADIVREAGLSGESGHSLIVNLGLCDELPYSVRAGPLATDPPAAEAGASL